MLPSRANSLACGERRERFLMNDEPVQIQAFRTAVGVIELQTDAAR